MPLAESAVIHERHRGRQYEVITRGLDETALEGLRFAAGVTAIESRTPSLEEIFVAYMTGTHIRVHHELSAVGHDGRPRVTAHIDSNTIQ